MTLRKAEFLDMTPKTQSIHRKKFDILDFIKAKNFVLQNTEKTNNRLGKIFKNHICDKEFVSRII